MSMAITGSLCPYLCTTNCGGGGGGQLLQWSWYFKKKGISNKNRRTEEQKNRRKDELIVTGLHDNANASASRTQRKAKKNTYMDRKNFKESSK
jgi:hypothetical protein